jgi:hypothetical protein
MKPTYCVCTDVALVDQTSNRLSLINVVDALHSPQFPIVFPQFTFVAAYLKADGDPESANGEASFTLNGQEILKGPVNLDFKGTTHTRIVTNISGFMIPGPGKLICKVEFPNTETAQWEMDVTQLAPPPFQQVEP